MKKKHTIFNTILLHLTLLFRIKYDKKIKDKFDLENFFIYFNLFYCYHFKKN